MKKINSIEKCFLLLLLLLLGGVQLHVFAQKNLELVSRVEYNSIANDVWHYTAPDGTDYVLMGLRSGVSIVSLADPANPVEIQFIPGQNSVWRDLKVWGHHAYVTADQPGTKEGLLVIDLSGVPDNVTWVNRRWFPGMTDSLFTCHNLWIDEFGYCYLSGCNVNQGGVVFLDVFSQPGNPKFVGFNAKVYAHDCYTLNNLLYTAEIFAGQFSIFDVADKANPVLLATQQTPFRFCHNVWTTDDGKTIFTTDERANAPTAAFDISDHNNIRQLDEFRPVATLNTGVIPHNAHVFGNYVVISHYTDGCVVVDAHRPENMVEVGYYDTCTDFKDGFHGAWGADPFLANGLIAVSDMENGLFILKPTYQRACYLEGKITDAATGSPIAGARVVIQSPDANFKTSNIVGEYKTGQVTAGTFNVRFRAKGYYDVNVPATLVNGEVTILDVAMTPLPPHSISGRVFDKTTGRPIEGAQVFLENEFFDYTDETDKEGRFILPAVLEGEYAVYVGKWGYENLALTEPLAGNTELRYELGLAYQDNFNTDLDWKVESTAQRGIWERGIPQGLFSHNVQWRPQGGSPNDPGDWAYVTGNQGNTIFDDQVDEGETTLISPPMQLRSRYNRPHLSFDYWFYNAISNNAANDSLTAIIHNGNTAAVLAVFATDKANVQEWTPADTFDLADIIELTDNMWVTFTASDRLETPNVVEAGIDNFRVWEGLPDELFPLRDDLVKMRIFPNPFNRTFTLDYNIEKAFDQAALVIFNPLGQIVYEMPLAQSYSRMEITTDFTPGMYYIALLLDKRMSKALRVVKGF